MRQIPTQGAKHVVGFVSTLYIVCKILGVVDHPWVWILSPLWLYGAIDIISSGLAILFFMILARAYQKRVTRSIDAALNKIKVPEDI